MRSLFFILFVVFSLALTHCGGGLKDLPDPSGDPNVEESKVDEAEVSEDATEEQKAAQEAVKEAEKKSLEALSGILKGTYSGVNTTIHVNSDPNNVIVLGVKGEEVTCTLWDGISINKRAGSISKELSATKVTSRGSIEGNTKFHLTFTQEMSPATGELVTGNLDVKLMPAWKSLNLVKNEGDTPSFGDLKSKCF